MISASLPKGTRNTADESKNDMETQLIVTAFIEKSELIFGSAILTADPRKGFTNEVSIIRTRSRFLLKCCGCCMRTLFEINKQMKQELVWF
jgi:hypothetical protein